jgi:hypothetical protein
VTKDLYIRFKQLRVLRTQGNRERRPEMVLKTPMQGQAPPKLVEALLRRLSRHEHSQGIKPAAFRLMMKDLMRANGYINVTDKQWENILKAMLAHEYGAVVDEDGNIKLAGDPPPFDDGTGDGRNSPLAA